MGNTALITGASGGIGYELAKIHAMNGGDLVLVARAIDKLEEIRADLETKYKVRVFVIQKDLSLHGSAYNIYNKVNDLGLEIDFLINNAGFGDFRHFAESDWPKQEKMINLNITTLTHLTRLYLPDMISRKKGRILNVASVASFCPGPTMSVYFASKAYVLSFSEALAQELKGTGISVTALCPGPTESNFHTVAVDGRKPKERKMPAALDVALYGYKAMVRGKVVAIPGADNRFLVALIRFLPRSLAAAAVRKVQESKHL